jgi:oxygen-independent coproporphyrinogen-3 oxidase
VESVDHNRWEKALINELTFLSRNHNHKKLKSIFFGGGTPSLMKPKTVFEAIQTAKEIWGVKQPIEITLEANPSSIEYQTFNSFKQAGINRISLGIQAFDDKALSFLGRNHDRLDAINAIEAAHKSFDRVSFDLIYARPQQTIESWLSELGQAVELAGEHMSVYQLTIEKGTAFYSQYRNGGFEMPNPETAGDFYEFTNEKLSSAGLQNYEISNYAHLGSECQHNLIYWRSEDYLGVGPGAHSRLTNIKGKRIAARSLTAPFSWLKEVEAKGNALVEQNILSISEQLTETIMMGLRLKEGVSLKKLYKLTGKTLDQLFDKEALHLLGNEGYLKTDGVYLRATESGRQRLNGVVRCLLDSVNIPN